MAGPDGSIMYQCGCGGAGGAHPNLEDPPQMLRSEKRDIYWTSDPSGSFSLEGFRI